MLYRIEGTNVKIAGTAPAFTLDKPNLPQWLRHVFNDADRLVFAADIEAADPASDQLPPHQSLTVLSFFKSVADLWNRLQIPGKPDRFKAWAASERLSAHLSKLLGPGVEALLLPEAKSRKSPPSFLELPQDRTAAYDATPLHEQVARLELLVTHSWAAASIEVAMHEAWLAHNLDGMNRLLDSQKIAFPESFVHILDHRNKKWLPELLRLIRETSADDQGLKTFVAVGALHLCGENGLISLLTKEGHTVTRLL